MHALQQGRAVFNPLPLTELQDPGLVPRVQASAKAIYTQLVALGTSDTGHQDTQEDQQAELKNLLASLNSQKTQGLWWDQCLETDTSNYWEQVKASKFPEFLHSFSWFHITDI